MESGKLSELSEYIETELKRNENEFKKISTQDMNDYIFIKEDAFKKELPNKAQILLLKNYILNCLKDSAQDIIYMYNPPYFSDETYGMDLLNQDLRLALAYSYMLNLLMQDEYKYFFNEEFKGKIIDVLSNEIKNLKEFYSNVLNQEKIYVMEMANDGFTKKIFGLLSTLNNPIEAINNRLYNIGCYKDVIGTKGISKTIVDDLFNKISKIRTPKEEKHFGYKTPEK